MGRISDAKARLLDVAFELIYDHSYGTVSVEEICQRAKVNKGSFYYFFRTKAELAIQAYETHWQSRRPEYDRIFSAQVPPLERLENWCDFLVETQKQRAAKYGHICGCPYGSVGAELATQDEQVRLKVQELIDHGIKYVASAIADADDEGLLSVADPEAMAQQVYAYAQGLLLQAKIRNDLGVLRHVKPTVLAMLGVAGVVR